MLFMHDLVCHSKRRLAVLSCNGEISPFEEGVCVRCAQDRFFLVRLDTQRYRQSHLSDIANLAAAASCVLFLQLCRPTTLSSTQPPKFLLAIGFPSCNKSTFVSLIRYSHLTLPLFDSRQFERSTAHNTTFQ